VNQIFLIGKAGKDAEAKDTKNGKRFAFFSIATNEGYYDSDHKRQELCPKWVDKTEWHSVIVFGKLADIAASDIRKGDTVAVNGKLQTRKWEDKDGNQKQQTEVVALEFVVQPKKQQGLPAKTDQYDAAQNLPDSHQDECPF